MVHFSLVREPTGERRTGSIKFQPWGFLIKVSGISLPVSARVARVLSIDFLVGVDFLQAYEAKIDYQTG